MATVYTTVGKAQVAAKLLDSGDTGYSALCFEYGAWGTGAGTAAVGDTTLFTEDVTGGYARVVPTRTLPGSNKTQFVWTLTALAGLTITNAGALTAITSGILIVKGDFTGVVLLTGDSITFTGSLQQT